MKEMMKFHQELFCMYVASRPTCPACKCGRCLGVVHAALHAACCRLPLCICSA
jgi:hypothetical protein